MKTDMDPKTTTFDALASAAGKFLTEISEQARSDNPAAYAAVDAALKTGEFFTSVQISIYEAGISVRASVNKITDGQEQAVLAKVDGVVRVLQ